MPIYKEANFFISSFFGFLYLFASQDSTKSFDKYSIIVLYVIIKGRIKKKELNLLILARDNLSYTFLYYH